MQNSAQSGSCNLGLAKQCQPKQQPDGSSAGPTDVKNQIVPFSDIIVDHSVEYRTRNSIVSNHDGSSSDPGDFGNLHAPVRCGNRNFETNSCQLALNDCLRFGK